MAATAMLKIAFFGHNLSTDFGEILYAEAEWHADKGRVTKTAIFFKSKMADCRHFENRYMPISQVAQ